MRLKPKRKASRIKVMIIILIPVIIATLAFSFVGLFYRDSDRIYPNISIAGVDVSWMTKDEAINALNLSEFEQRIHDASVTIIFPDYSELIITGEDINLSHDAISVVNSAFSVGRGQGFVRDTMSFISRHFQDTRDFGIFESYDTDKLFTIVEEFTNDYNNRLASTEPIIYSNKIIFTKGAGQELAEKMIVQDLAYLGFFDSYETGQPITIDYTLPETVTNSAELFAVHHGLHVPVTSAEINLETLEVSESMVGVDFDIFYAVEMLNATESGKTVTINVRYIQPETTTEYLEDLLFRDSFGEVTTWVHGDNNRITNIQISSEAINGLVLNPGDEFSFNNVVGVRSSAKGYRPGGAFVNGETVSVIGGGVCQVASTLHAAMMHSDLTITERHGHSRSVPYLPRGRDATVFWNKLDFKFENNTSFPVRIDFKLDGRYLTASVYGTATHKLPIRNQVTLA